MTDIYFRIFVYSRQQYEQRKELDRKMGKNTRLGSVLVNGISKPFTDIITDLKRAKYSDSIVVTSGDIRKIKYAQGS